MQVEVETLTIELSTVPSDDRPVFVTGNFCKWLPDLEEYRMTMVSPGHYRYQFPEDADLPDPIEYKYTRGGWNQVELDRAGRPYANRFIKAGETLIRDSVIRWQTDLLAKSDVSPIVETVSEDFEIAQFSKTRRVRVLLPHEYYDNPDQRFPVLYMTDGQNLFGEGSEYGNWEIDKSLTKLATTGRAGVILVALDHGEEDRVQELSPYDNPKLGKGHGAKFLQFIAGPLKTYIDAKYRTKTDRLNTGIGGSSVGGLLAAYAALMFPQTFGKFLVFSPALWISEKVYFDAIHFFEPFETRIYLYAGGKEGAHMIPNVNKLKETLETQSFGYSRVKIKSSVDAKGEHEEKQWSKEFPKAFEWLFFE